MFSGKLEIITKYEYCVLISHTIKSTCIEALVTGFETKARDPDENKRGGRISKSTMRRIKLNPHMIFSENGRTSERLLIESFA